MNDKQFDQLFDEIAREDVPSVKMSEKTEAIKMATAEFSQAFAKSARPNEDSKPMLGVANFLRSLFMSPIQNKFVYGAFSTIAAAFIFLAIFPLNDPLQSPLEQQPAIQGPAAMSTPALEQSPTQDQPVVAQVTKTENHLTSKITQIEKEKPENLEPRSQSVKTFEPEIKEERFAQQDAAASEGQASRPPTLLTRPSADMAASPEAASALSDQSRKAKENQAAARKRLMAGKLEEIVVTASKGGTQHESDSPSPAWPTQGREEYPEYEVNSMLQVKDQPVSTFSIDVDTASYSLVRNQLKNGFLPDPQAVRAEEFINYFDYEYALPKDKRVPFKPSITVLDSPWNADRKLVHIGIKGLDIQPSEQPDSNIVFLLDVSGSMNQANKLPLVKQSMALLLETLKPTDLVSIVVYAGAAGVVLEPTAVKEESKIMNALQQLRAGGSTAGGAGIRRAYELAEANFIKKGVNRIILATDGDFNVGQRSNQDLKTLVERKRRNGVFLSVLGFGRDNYQDDMMQTLAQNGNGVAAYIDTLSEAQKVLVHEATSSLFTIANDVKIQVEFNPAVVSEYRLVGYETRALKREDFNNDKVDAGDIGAGHTVTAIYEITPANSPSKSVDDLRYQDKKKSVDAISNELGYLKLRYKLPKKNKSKLIEAQILDSTNHGSNDVNFSIAVAGFAQLLMNSPFVGDLSYDDLIHQAQANKGDDPFGYRAEFIQLVRMAKIAKP